MLDVVKIIRVGAYVLGALVAGMLLYQLFFGGENSGYAKACQAIERPLAFSYYKYCLTPSLRADDDIAEALSGGLWDVKDTTALGDEDDTNLSSRAAYTTGWQ